MAKYIFDCDPKSWNCVHPHDHVTILEPASKKEMQVCVPCAKLMITELGAEFVSCRPMAMFWEHPGPEYFAKYCGFLNHAERHKAGETKWQ